jgi:DNA polymerase-3 subunit chi
MTRVDFYILPPGDERQRLVFACRLTEKAYRQGLTVYLRAGDETTASQLDQLLWTFRQGSFVPHARAEERDTADKSAGEPICTAQPPAGWRTEPAPDSIRGMCGNEKPPVLVGVAPNAPETTGLMINLAKEPPEQYQRLARLAELVGQDESSRQAGRERYRHYREQNLTLEIHPLTTWPSGGDNG